MAGEKRYWFGRKQFGWGYGPRTWEGWLTSAVFVLLIVTMPRYVETRFGHQAMIAASVGLIVIFFVVFFWKLERSRPR